MLRLLVGQVQNYPWGDTSSIATMLGVEPNGQPWAEMWFGTHHIAPSHLDTPDGPLLAQVAGEMDMLVKILAADQPLSLQTHPTKEQAVVGFERENSLGIDVRAPHRMYKDASDKPEVLIALSRFEALCGFQSTSDIARTLGELHWTEELDIFTTQGINAYLSWCFGRLDAPDLNHAPQWLRNIAVLYPQDPALRVAPLLHHVVLEPGEALCLPAGNLHAYLHGCGLEIMNSSDNVVRAGFTLKHVDVAEVLSVLDTSPLHEPIVRPSIEGMYPSPSNAFSLQRISSNKPVQFSATPTSRVIFGPFESVNSSDKPQMYFLPAGDTGELTCRDGQSIWVCTQN